MLKHENSKYAIPRARKCINIWRRGRLRGPFQHLPVIPPMIRSRAFENLFRSWSASFNIPYPSNITLYIPPSGTFKRVLRGNGPRASSREPLTSLIDKLQGKSGQKFPSRMSYPRRTIAIGFRAPTKLLFRSFFSLPRNNTSESSPGEVKRDRWGTLDSTFRSGPFHSATQNEPSF